MNIEKILNYKKLKNCQLIELYIEKESNLFLELNQHGNFENFIKSKKQGLGVRIIKNYKQILSYTTDFREENILKMIDNCYETIDYLDQEKSLNFIKNEIFEGIVDEYNLNKISTTPLEEKLNFLEKNKKDLISEKKIIVNIESIIYDETIYETKIINSEGLYKKEKGAYCGGSCSLSIKNKKQIETGYYYHYDRNILNLFNCKIVKNAYDRAYKMIGSKTLKTGLYKVILKPEIAISFLSLLSNSLNGENIYKGKSLFKNNFKKKVIDSKITIIDDATMKGNIGTTFFDSEGVTTKRNILIKNGFLQTGLYNLTIANLLKVTSTGNCSRGYKSLPSIDSHNLYIEKGKTKKAELIEILEDGLIINDLMGIHMADPISGNFSLGASGFLVKKHKIINSFRGVTISGNILDMFNEILNVGDDLIFKTTIGSPSLIINKVVISGS